MSNGKSTEFLIINNNILIFFIHPCDKNSDFIIDTKYIQENTSVSLHDVSNRFESIGLKYSLKNCHFQQQYGAHWKLDSQVALILYFTCKQYQVYLMSHVRISVHSLYPKLI